jgi:two-component sensor histidine kinase
MPELLQILADGLRQAFARSLSQVRLELTCDSISLPVDQAIPLALLVNEVVTNAYKHAFPNDAQGEITVSLRRSPERELILRIADSGIGYQPTGGGVGMGLRLIRNFAAQLQGTLIFSTPAQGAGTAIALTISPPAQV